MEAGIIAGGKLLAPTFVKSFLDSSKGLFGNISAEIKQIINDGLVSYLGKYETNYKYTKTILHRHEPVPFYDIYFPVRLTRGSFQNLLYIEEIFDSNSHSLKVLKTESVNEIFLRTRYITVTGNAGSGKSTLVKHVFMNCIKENFGIPVLIELRNVVYSKLGINDYIKEIIFDNNLAKSDTIFKRLLSSGKFVFLIDGVDEVRKESQQSLLLDLSKFIEKYKHNRFMITSRPGVNIDLFPFFHNYQMKSLDNDEVYKFIAMQKLPEAIMSAVISHLKNNKIAYIDSYLSNPLLLTIYLVLFSNNSSIPEKKSLFYRRVFDVLFREHDTISKIGYERNLRTNMSQEKIEDVLKFFSYITFFEGHFTFEKEYLYAKLIQTKNKLRSRDSGFNDFHVEDFIYDLIVSIGLWVEDELYTYFVHRSMQEYFVALSMCNSSANKEEIYNRILKRIGLDFMEAKQLSIIKTDSNKIELSNILSLCSEMDTFAYNKYFKIPLMKYFVESIDQGDGVEKIRLLYKAIDLQLGFESIDERHVVRAIAYGNDTYSIIPKDELSILTSGGGLFNFDFNIPEEFRYKPDLYSDLNDLGALKIDFVLTFRDKSSIDWMPKPIIDNVSNLSNQFVSKMKNSICELEKQIDIISKSDLSLADLI